MAKARRGGRRHRPSSSSEGGRSGGEHWRADGRPKARFPTEDAANRSSFRLRLEEGADLDPYPCQYCGGWHLGSRPG
jgi:hypothetical protein